MEVLLCQAQLSNFVKVAALNELAEGKPRAIKVEGTEHRSVSAQRQTSMLPIINVRIWAIR